MIDPVSRGKYAICRYLRQPNIDFSVCGGVVVCWRDVQQLTGKTAAEIDLRANYLAGVSADGDHQIVRKAAGDQSARFRATGAREIAALGL
ncbi:hypothetical protein [Neorhizobium sp. P12A]|uniref:hypothetical protein n=1 Tax=Neorhizobium sp. P12A TaxID=2268027 RepID=UPI0011ED7A87|nr:hypothetical protein [Neorhizobium sp. P12A]